MVTCSLQGALLEPCECSGALRNPTEPGVGTRGTTQATEGDQLCVPGASYLSNTNPGRMRG